MTGVWTGQVWDFCDAHGVSGRRRNCASLCTEELAENIVRHGFKDNKNHSVDIRISYVNEEIIICLKDDGIPFNTAEAAKLFGSEDDEQKGAKPAFHNIGLRLVNQMSKSMAYQNTFSLNILTIVI